MGNVIHARTLTVAERLARMEQLNILGQEMIRWRLERGLPVILSDGTIFRTIGEFEQSLTWSAGNSGTGGADTDKMG